MGWVLKGSLSVLFWGAQCNFLEAGPVWGKDTKIVYRHYATLYFVFCVDESESELGILDLIQVHPRARTLAPRMFPRLQVGGQERRRGRGGGVPLGRTGRASSCRSSGARAAGLSGEDVQPPPPPPIQVFVETLDRCFENVCELDLVFHMDKVHTITDEIVQAGMVLETNIADILTALDGQRKHESASSRSAGRTVLKDPKAQPGASGRR